MDGYKKKSAVRAGTPATENRKTISINSILKNGGEVAGCVLRENRNIQIK